MTKALPPNEEPAWLSWLTSEAIEHGPLPLRDILRNSLFYPAAGFDGDPIRYLAGYIHSFVYVDYGVGEEVFEQALHTPGFRGYRILGKRAVTEKTLIARNWDPQSMALEDRPRVEQFQAQGVPFCTWVVFERLPGFDEEHGPSRFSLLYWWHEGMTAFQKLYVSRRIAPKAVAIIQPGHGFGLNWTDFTNPSGIFAKVVEGNAAGLPKLLLFGGHARRNIYRSPCWPDYRNCLGFFSKAGGGSIGIWE